MTSSDLAVPASTEMERFLAEQGGAPVGLEDVNARDIVMAKISIDHKAGKFVDSLTGESFDEIDTVLLGLIKGRVLWDVDPDAKNPLLCKSNNGIVGHPVENLFPVKVFTEAGGIFNPGPTVECATCPLAAWGSHPSKDTPWCAEQMTFPLTVGGVEDVAGGTITFQRSGLGATRAYLSSYIREKRPMFMHRTLITLQRARTGTVDYATPKFVRGAAIEDVDLLRSYAAQFALIKARYGEPLDAEVAPAPAAAFVPQQTVIDGEIGEAPPF